MKDLSVFSKIDKIYGEQSNISQLLHVYDIEGVKYLDKGVITSEEGTPIRDLLPFAFRTEDRREIVVLSDRGTMSFDPQNCNVELIAGILCRKLSSIPTMYHLVWVEGNVPYSGIGYAICCPEEISKLSDILYVSDDVWKSLAFEDKLNLVKKANPNLAKTFSELYVIDRVLAVPQRSLSQYLFDTSTNIMIPIGFSQGLFQSEQTAVDSVYADPELQRHMMDYSTWEPEKFKSILCQQSIYIPGDIIPTYESAILLESRLSQLGIELELFR